ncbi:MAG TPA: hypothetical protein VD837_17350 [Terriglobales bacterium]|nr:hypothetical protein [Terriglobales bacterium]
MTQKTMLALLLAMSLVGYSAAAQLPVPSSEADPGVDVEVVRTHNDHGALRATPDAELEAQKAIQNDLRRNLNRFRDAQALQKVRIKISENHIVVSGPELAEIDAGTILSIAQTHADGRTIFNRLGLEPDKK